MRSNHAGRLFALVLLVVFLLPPVSGCAKTTASKSKRAVAPAKVATAKPPAAKPVALDLAKIERLYKAGEYEKAILEVNRQATTKENILNLDLLRWAAKLSLATKNYVMAYYYSGWINAADSAPNKIWDAAPFLFSVDPDYTWVIQEELPKSKGMIDKRHYSACIATAAYVGAVRRYVQVRSAPTKADMEYFDGLVTTIYGLDSEIAKDQYDLAASLAEARFYHFMVVANSLRVAASKAELEETLGVKMADQAPSLKELRRVSRKFDLNYYKMVWINLEAGMSEMAHYPDALFIVGVSLYNLGQNDNDPAMIKRGLGYLESSNRQKPNADVQGVIRLARAALAKK